MLSVGPTLCMGPDFKCKKAGKAGSQAGVTGSVYSHIRNHDSKKESLLNEIDAHVYC